MTALLLLLGGLAAVEGVVYLVQLFKVGPKTNGDLDPRKAAIPVGHAGFFIGWILLLAIILVLSPLLLWELFKERRSRTAMLVAEALMRHGPELPRRK